MRRRRITAMWSIKPGSLRTADLAATPGHEALQLMASNHRTHPEGGWAPDLYGPYRWLVASAVHGTVATGTVYDGTDYDAPVRQAMLEAELAADAYRAGQVPS